MRNINAQFFIICKEALDINFNDIKLIIVNFFLYFLVLVAIDFVVFRIIQTFFNGKTNLLVYAIDFQDLHFV